MAVGACGTNALVSANAGSLSAAQVEPSATNNPVNHQIQLAAYADSQFDFVPGISKSTNGGVCWSAPIGSGPLLPNPRGLTWGSRTSPGQVAGGDASIAWGLGSTVYYGTLGFQDNAQPAAACNVGGLYVYKSVDGGDTWTAPAAPVASNTKTIYRDKGYLAVDSNPASPHAGNVYITWDDDEYTGCPQTFGNGGNFSVRRIMFSRSTDGGTTWSAPTTLASGCLFGSVPTVAIDGAVYVVWFDCNSADRELVRKSTDGGSSFSAGVVAASGTLAPRASVSPPSACPNPLAGANFRVTWPAPMIATDPTNAGRVYVTWFGCPNDGSGHPNVYFSASEDGGNTWSPSPIPVNDDVGLGYDHFFPWMSVDDTGVIRIMFGDNRLKTPTYLYDIFVATSADHGTSFGANVRVTTKSSNPNNDGFGGTFIGDYFGMAACGTPVWTDTRNANDDVYAAASSACSPPSVGGIAEAPSASSIAIAVAHNDGFPIAGVLAIFAAVFMLAASALALTRARRHLYRNASNRSLGRD